MKNMEINIDSYIWLIKDYLYENISIECFKYIYSRSFTREKEQVENEQYSLLRSLFKSIAEFYELGKISEGELRAQCKDVLKGLDFLKK